MLLALPSKQLANMFFNQQISLEEMKAFHLVFGNGVDGVAVTCCLDAGDSILTIFNLALIG